ncbi:MULTISPECIES: CGNR zinc finger domain-containing protein [Bacillus]|uniref:CGNR zinc finger domain-containing protein n=1 Tax=Bacillus TaxID=1386 RepID=UPI000D01B696|nr:MULTISPECIES: CGNR zinc finger domain-containing protein [Bacillus]MDR0125750.1 CGNR zinc finger domain-containing protein [Bacillus zhangzhouensis]PRO42292.1 hypothetical protein C6W18_00180 [Bacillus sp. LLTC93]
MRLLNYKAVGGDLSLDFINTANNRYNQFYQELFMDTSALVNWSKESTHFIDLKIKGSGISIEEIRLLRDTMFNILNSIHHKEDVSREDIILFNKWLYEAHRGIDICQNDEEKVSVKHLDGQGVFIILYPIVRSFYHLLKSNQTIKQCSSTNCDWFFIDKTKNQNKQWCSMQLCGNREKARKFYKNKKIDIKGVEKW